jgi:2-polyprenyl-3-methyl-5-hydroxy-6-metoxy-1,4-benzoquinol methylase
MKIPILFFEELMLDLRFFYYKSFIKFIPFKKVYNANITVSKKKLDNNNVKLNTDYDFTIVKSQIKGKYFWHEISNEFEIINTAKELNVDECSLVKLVNNKGKLFCELVMPKGYGIVYLKLLQTSSFMDNFYNTIYDQQALKISENPKLLISERNVNKVEKYCEIFLKSKSKILDVGCGYGDQLNFFKEKGHITKGIEPGLTRSIFAKEQFNLDVLNIKIEEIDSYLDTNEKFDLIYLNQVLEHLSNPIKVLKILKKYLKTDGYLFIAVPNFNFEGIIVKTFSPIHTHSFTTNGLYSAVKFIGFELSKNYSDHLYNIMLFKNSISDNHPLGERQILKSLKSLFYLKNHSSIKYNTDILGEWSFEFHSNKIPDFSKLPIIINTNNEKTNLLFK